MADTVQPIKELSEQEQAAYFRARSRTRSFRDPAKGLFRTHRLTGAAAIPIATIDTDAIFPSRDRPITFVAEVGITGAAAAGIIWEFGDSTTGAKLAISAGSLFIAAGAAAGNAGADDSIAIAALGEIGAGLLITVAINPGNGKVRVWIDDDVVIRANGVSQMTNGWTAIENGALASAHATSSTQRGQAINTAPADFILTRPLDAFQGQLPRQFGS